MIDFVRDTFSELVLSTSIKNFSEIIQPPINKLDFKSKDENINIQKLKSIYETILLVESQFSKIKNNNSCNPKKTNLLNKKIKRLKSLVENRVLE